jgi:arylsulfatase
MPAMKGDTMPERAIASEHLYARGLRKGEWKIVWGKKQPEVIAWELYHLSEDPCEQNDLASKQPEKLKELVELWDGWAKKVGVHVPKIK